MSQFFLGGGSICYARKFKSPVGCTDGQDSGARLLHPNHYALTLARITLNGGYIRLAARAPGVRPEEAPVEVFMRRRDLLEEIHRVVEMAEPGYTRRRGGW